MRSDRFCRFALLHASAWVALEPQQFIIHPHTTHWLLIAGITPVLIIACFMTFRVIEHPATQSVSTITARFRALLPQRS